MITVKQYAESVGKTHQAVYKQLKAKRYQERLEGHVIKKNGTTYLDDEAISILNESRTTPIVVMEHNNDERIKQLEEENKNLLIQMNQMQAEFDRQKTDLYERLDQKSKKIEQLQDQVYLLTNSTVEQQVEKKKKHWWQFKK